MMMMMMTMFCAAFYRQCDNDNRNQYKYVCIKTYQPDTKSNPNPNPNPNPTTKQHAIVNIQLNTVTYPTYPDKFIRDNVVAPSVLIFDCMPNCHTAYFICLTIVLLSSSLYFISVFLLYWFSFSVFVV